MNEPIATPLYSTVIVIMLLHKCLHCSRR